ncbi:succinate dehydrogenase cytochrome b subunit [candidate division KSB1 bacterium]
MADFSSKIWSSVGKKVMMGLTGLALVSFVVVHLLGNLMLFSSDSAHYNKYSHFLLSLGELIIAVELVLVAFFIIHMISGVTVWLTNRKVRPVSYAKSASAGSPSRKTISSMTMIYTGAVVLIFVFLHVSNFKYGDVPEVNIGGVIMKDFYNFVYDAFETPTVAFPYVFAILLLGFHLRHGFWSAFQSLGINHPRYNGIIYGLGWAITIVLSSGFIIIPLWIYFTGGAR